MITAQTDDVPRIAMLFRDYGAAIGPSVAFMLGIVALYLKELFEGRQRRRRSKRLLAQFIDLAVIEPPQWFPVPDEDGYARGDANRGNRSTVTLYHSHLLAAKAFLDANEKQVVEDASLEVIRSLYQCKWRFDKLLAYMREKLDAEEPIKKVVFDQIDAFHAALTLAAGRDSVPKMPA
ncbi:MAG: hypothetical protein QOH06_589 [Acidobacteriota bacterium]|jgi:hypothetical protein|nr:hypothetical protein [Acidobacteriota bacterium]